MRKEARHTQMRDRASGVHPDILEHLPPNKTRVCLLYCFPPNFKNRNMFIFIMNWGGGLVVAVAVVVKQLDW